MNFLSEDLVVLPIVSGTSLTANTATTSNAIDTLNAIHKDMCIVVNTTGSDNDTLKMVVSTCDTNNGTFVDLPDIAYKADNTTVVAGGIAKLGIKEDQLQRFVKVSFTASANSTVTANLLALPY